MDGPGGAVGGAGKCAEPGGPGTEQSSKHRSNPDTHSERNQMSLVSLGPRGHKAGQWAIVRQQPRVGGRRTHRNSQLDKNNPGAENRPPRLPRGAARQEPGGSRSRRRSHDWPHPAVVPNCPPGARATEHRLMLGRPCEALSPVCAAWQLLVCLGSQQRQIQGKVTPQKPRYAQKM